MIDRGHYLLPIDGRPLRTSALARAKSFASLAVNQRLLIRPARAPIASVDFYERCFENVQRLRSAADSFKRKSKADERVLSRSAFIGSNV